MKLKSLSVLALSIVMSLPIHAQIYLDSTEIAKVLNPKATVIQSKTTVEDSDSDEETDSIIPAFATDNHLSWKENITARLDGIFHTSLLQTVQAGVMIWDLTDDVPLYQYNERMHMRPASTMKCLTAIAALDKLGSDYTLKTRVYYTGEIEDSTHVLHGDLYCLGGMDPMFDNSDMRELVNTIRNEGITQIDGNIYTDLSFKERNRLGAGWCWDD